MLKKLMIAGAVVVVTIVIFAMALPTILHKAGLHPQLEERQTFDLKGKRALIVTTSHAVLSKPGETFGKPTGVMASEFTHPYYEFQDAGMDVDIASIKGGQIPVDPQTLLYFIRTPEDERYLEDDILQAKIDHSMKIDDVDFTEYDAVFMSGGWGAAYDLGQSIVLGTKISEAYNAERPIMGSVCHGALGFIRAINKNGQLLISGRKMTGVSDKQVNELGISITPLHPEAELRKAGALYSSESAFMDFFATHVVIDHEKRFVTGQNQNSGLETAQEMMKLISKN